MKKTSVMSHCMHYVWTYAFNQRNFSDSLVRQYSFHHRFSRRILNLDWKWFSISPCYREFHANTPIKNQHFSASDDTREILKTVLCSYINPIWCVIGFMIPNGYLDGQMQWQTFTLLFSKQFFCYFFVFVDDFLGPTSISHPI